MNRENEWQRISQDIPDPCVILMMDGSYVAWSMRAELRFHGKTREAALVGLRKLREGADV